MVQIRYRTIWLRGVSIFTYYYWGHNLARERLPVITRSAATVTLVRCLLALHLPTAWQRLFQRGSLMEDGLTQHSNRKSNCHNKMRKQNLWVRALHTYSLCAKQGWSVLRAFLSTVLGREQGEWKVLAPWWASSSWGRCGESPRPTPTY